VTLPRHGLLVTGVYWKAGQCALTLADPAGAETVEPIGPGAELGWRFRGPRRCIGIRRPGAARRQPCHLRSTLAPEAGSAQCPVCADGDPGGAVARDGALDDPRVFSLYLAYFGPGLLKIGITAAERGANRLAEQGALAYTWLGRGSLLTVRRAEIIACAGGIVRDRIGRAAKVAAWWHREDPDGRFAALADTAQRLAREVTWPEGLALAPCEPHDLTGSYALDRRPLARDVREITAFGDDAVLDATIAWLAGRDALLKNISHDIDAESSAKPALLMNLRLLSGWIIAPSGSADRTGAASARSGSGEIATRTSPLPLLADAAARNGDVLF
jgi:hypothetical protein